MRDVLLEAINHKFSEVDRRLDKIEKTIQSLVTTLDVFLKRLTAHEGEFEIMKAEMALVKKALKQKLGVDISFQGK